ncbi:hypothetical protein ESCO_006483 [Escovopsis weberi]|uniref:Uncharacterized protein n=1 Tax=Escovopsis weberi TaxID=150374 RepID=A0A0M8N0U1_ESCWE|nr:hypothetical protein ESCO_006483 [Escovopsis weberi]
MSPILEKVHPDLIMRAPSPDSDPTEASGEHAISDVAAQIFETPALPLSVVLRILKHCLVFENQVIHAVSRLDPHQPPAQVPFNRLQKECFHHRLVVGQAGVSIVAAANPNRMLAPLLVCRAWHLLGSHLFYGENTNTAASRRTSVVAWLSQAVRLKTLGVYLSESDPNQARRKHEPRGGDAGVDHIYCLRGLEGVTFWDFDKWLSGGNKQHPVRDFLFVVDVNSAVRRPKTREDEELSQLRNLALVLEGFEPSEAMWDMLTAFFERKKAVSEGDGDPSDHATKNDSRGDAGTESAHGSDVGRVGVEARPRPGRSTSRHHVCSEDMEEAFARWHAEEVLKERA